VTTSEAGDDDVEEGGDGSHDGLEDGGDSVYDGHETCSDGVADALDLFVIISFLFT
jgi:hypothetical protein